MNQKYAQIKQKQSKTVINKYDGGFWCERTTGDQLFYWMKHYELFDYFGQIQQFKVKMP